MILALDGLSCQFLMVFDKGAPVYVGFTYHILNFLLACLGCLFNRSAHSAGPLHRRVSCYVLVGSEDWRVRCYLSVGLEGWGLVISGRLVFIMLIAPTRV